MHGVRSCTPRSPVGRSTAPGATKASQQEIQVQSVRSPEKDVAVRVGDRFKQHLDPADVRQIFRELSVSLREAGISFEGNALPVSITPTVVPLQEAHGIASAGAAVRKILNRAISMLVEEHRSRRPDGPMHRFFTPYYKWWDIIASEQRQSDHIELLRYDMVRDDAGYWSFMETNSACPGGTIHCAQIRDAWMSTQLGREVCAAENISTFTVDQPAGFVRFLADKAFQIDQRCPNVALLNYRGVYTNELDSLVRCHTDLVAKGELSAGEFLLGDVRELTCVNGQAHLRGVPIALIHNKMLPYQVDPSDPELAGWLAAATAEKTQFLNSFGATCLGAGKRALALLSDPAWHADLNLSADEQQAVDAVIPFTRLVEDLLRMRPERSLLGSGRRAFVLKADALTRGTGIFIGDAMTPEEWVRAIASTRDMHGVAQAKCDIPTRQGIRLTPADEIIHVTEYYGVDAFMFGDEFAGLVGRAHVNEIFNVGSCGSEAPVLVIGNGR